MTVNTEMFNIWCDKLESTKIVAKITWPYSEWFNSIPQCDAQRDRQTENL